MSDTHNFHGEFIWRIAGFACEELEKFADEQLAVDIAGLCSESTDDGWSPWWGGRRASLMDHFYDRFSRKFELLRRVLGDIVRQDRFQSAVAYSSPGAAGLLYSYFSQPPPTRNSKAKRRELLAMRYLQRFVTKCETAASVGPVATGHIGRTRNVVEYRLNLAAYQSSTFVSTRTLVQLTHRLRRHPNIIENARVRRSSGTAVVDGRATVHPTVGVLNLRPECVAILRATTRPTPVADLHHSIECTADELHQMVYALLRLGLLVDDLGSIPHCDAPLAATERLIVDAAASLVPEADLLRVLSRALTKWCESDSHQKSAIVDGINRAMSAADMDLPGPAGQFYADSLPIVEDGLCGDSTLILDHSWAEPMLAALEAEVLRTLRYGPQHHGTDVERRLRSESDRRAPLARVIAWSWDKVSVPAADAVTSKKRGGRSPRHVITSPDVMIAASDIHSMRRGEYEILLSESHGAIGCAGFQTRVLSNPTEWLGSVSAFLSTQLEPAELVLPTISPTNKTSYIGPLPTVRYLEVGSPAPDDSALVDLDELEVEADEEAGLRLMNRVTGRQVAVLPNGPPGRLGPLDVFRPPTFQRSRSPGPRVRHGRIIQKRASWAITFTDVPGTGAEPFEIFVWAQHLRVQHSLPRWIFIRPADEQKPICIDFFNAFLCEELLRQVRRSKTLHVEEMYPSPAEAWAIGPDGHHLSELRLLYAAGA